MEAECSESFLCPDLTTTVSLGMLGAEGHCEYKQRKWGFPISCMMCLASVLSVGIQPSVLTWRLCVGRRREHS